LDANTVLSFVDVLIEDVVKVVFNLLSSLLDFSFGLRAKKLRTSDGVLEARSRDFYSHSSPDFLVMDVLSLHTHLFHRVWSQKSSDLSYDWPVESLQNDCVLNLKESIDKEDIDCGTETLDNFDFKDSALEFFLLCELFADPSLALMNEVSHQVGKTFTCNTRSWHETNVLVLIWVLVIDT